MVALRGNELVDVLLSLDLDGREALDVLGPTRLLPVLGLLVLDPEEGLCLKVADGRGAALGKLLARNVFSLDQAE